VTTKVNSGVFIVSQVWFYKDFIPFFLQEPEYDIFKEGMTQFFVGLVNPSLEKAVP